jgi:hypothetical protein
MYDSVRREKVMMKKGSWMAEARTSSDRAGASRPGQGGIDLRGAATILLIKTMPPLVSWWANKVLSNQCHSLPLLAPLLPSACNLQYDEIRVEGIAIVLFLTA